MIIFFLILHKKKVGTIYYSFFVSYYFEIIEERKSALSLGKTDFLYTKHHLRQ